MGDSSGMAVVFAKAAAQKHLGSLLHLPKFLPVQWSLEKGHLQGEVRRAPSNLLHLSNYQWREEPHGQDLLGGEI